MCEINRKRRKTEMIALSTMVHQEQHLIIVGLGPTDQVCGRDWVMLQGSQLRDLSSVSIHSQAQKLNPNGQSKPTPATPEALDACLGSLAIRVRMNPPSSLSS